MLQIEVVDDTCAEGEAYHHTVPLDTPWNDIQTLVRLMYPTCSSCLIEVVED